MGASDHLHDDACGRALHAAMETTVTEILATIDAPHFNCGIVLRDGKVIEAAPIVGYMKRGKWTRARVRAYCKEKGWKISVVWEMKR